MNERAYLSLGSNLGDRIAELGAARHALIDQRGIRFVSCSAVIETDPVDVLEQPRFLNQVVGIDTRLEPRDLLAACLEIERGLGRDRAAAVRRGPRTIDIDVLLYGGRTIDEPGLRIPHERLVERPFFVSLCVAAGAQQRWLPSMAGVR